MITLYIESNPVLLQYVANLQHSIITFLFFPSYSSYTASVSHSLPHVHTHPSDELQLTFTSLCITKCQPVSLAIMFNF